MYNNFLEPTQEDLDIAWKLLEAGEPYCCSTWIDDETITCGYGLLDQYGNWQYPLLDNHVKWSQPNVQIL